MNKMMRLPSGIKKNRRRVAGIDVKNITEEAARTIGTSGRLYANI